MVLTLNYEKRGEKQSPKSLKDAGKMPAVFYGRKQASTPITVSTREFEKVWKKAGETTVVSLKGEGEDIQSLVKAVDRHPVFGTPRHADFYVFEKGQKLEIQIPIEFVGVSPAVKDLGGVLVKVVHDLEIEAEPKDLPQKVEVDISALTDFDSVITAKEIKLPAGVSLRLDSEEVVASVYEPKDEVVEEAPVDLSTIEVMKKGKEPAPGEAGEGDAGGADPKAEEKK